MASRRAGLCLSFLPNGRWCQPRAGLSFPSPMPAAGLVPAGRISLYCPVSSPQGSLISVDGLGRAGPSPIPVDIAVGSIGCLLAHEHRYFGADFGKR
jgi:hypothetical protein